MGYSPPKPRPLDIHEEKSIRESLLLYDTQMKGMSEINELHPPVFSLSDYFNELTQQGYIESRESLNLIFLLLL